MKLVKGMIFLPGCDVKYEEPEHRLYFRTTGGKVYYFQVERLEGARADIAAEKVKLRSWMKAIQWSLNSARGFKDASVAEGNWLYKRGGKSHNYVNWKKRRFALRGNLLLYYSEDPELFDVFPYLKGYIDLASITSIDARQEPSDNVDKPIYFKVTVDNEREFFIAANTQEQKRAWIKAIKTQTKALADRLNYANLRSIQKNEKVIFSGDLFRLNKFKEGQKTYIVLTNMKLRYYDSEGDFDKGNFGGRMIGAIPLLGTATQVLKDSPLTHDRSTLQMHDLQGHTFTFIAKSEADAKRLVDEIRSASRALISSVIAKETTISLNTYALGKNGNEYGYTIAQIDKEALTMINLTADKDKRIEWDEIERVSLTDDRFSLKYTRRKTTSSKTIEFKSANAIAFFDTISVVMTLREEIAAKEKKLKAKGVTAPAKLTTRSNSAKAMPIAPSMVHTRTSDNDLQPAAADAVAADDADKKKKKTKKTAEPEEPEQKAKVEKPKAPLSPPSDPKMNTKPKETKPADKEAKPATKESKPMDKEAKTTDEKPKKSTKSAAEDTPVVATPPTSKTKSPKKEERESEDAPVAADIPKPKKKTEAVAQSPEPAKAKKEPKPVADLPPSESPTPKKKKADSPAPTPAAESPKPKKKKTDQTPAAASPKPAKTPELAEQPEKSKKKPAAKLDRSPSASSTSSEEIPQPTKKAAPKKAPAKHSESESSSEDSP